MTTGGGEAVGVGAVSDFLLAFPLTLWLRSLQGEIQ